MNLTALLGLGKPLPGENYDIGVPNNNMDLIDAAIDADRDRLAALEAGAGGVPNYIPWTNYTSTIRTDTGGAAASGTSVSVARYMKIGNLLIVTGQGSVGASIVSGCSAMLPPLTAGITAVRRELLCGTFIITASSGSAPSGQLSIARMTTAKDRVLGITDTNAFCDAPINSQVYWQVMYEVS